MESVRHWINGSASEPDGGDFFEVLNPLDDLLYTRAAKGSAADVVRAIHAADEAFAKFKNSRPSEREAWLIAAAELLEKQADEFIEILIDEIGSPITKARREVATSIGVLRAAAGTTRRLAGKTMPTDVPGRLSITVREPLGVVAGITPFNVPLIKGIKHSAMPLATGNTVVMLPSEEAPTIGVRIAQLYCDAGFPDGVCNVVCGSGYEIGDCLTTDPRVRLVGFTGSTRVGRHIGGLCGEHGKRANDTRYGLTASVYTSDLDAAMHFARNLHAGMVHINGSTVQEEAHIPFGGVGDSGFGREGTEVSIDELTEWKWITINGSLGPRT